MSILGKSGRFVGVVALRAVMLLVFAVLAGGLMKLTKSPMLGAVVALGLWGIVELVLNRKAAEKAEAESSKSGTWQKPK